MMIMCFSEIIAKKKKNKNIKQSLMGHTVDALLIYKDWLDKNKKIVKKFCENWNIDFNDFCNLCFLTIYIHDIGKATKQFQERIKKNENCGSVSHAFFGLPLIQSTFYQDKEELNTVLKLSVLSHHSQLYTNIFNENPFGGRITYSEPLIKEHIDNCKTIYDKYFVDKFILRYNLKHTSKNQITAMKIRNEELNLLKRKIKIEERTKVIYSFLLSILKHCDQQASANFEEVEEKLEERDESYNELLFYKLNSVERKIKLDKINYNYKKMFTLSKRDILGVDKKGNSVNRYEYQIRASKLNNCGIISAPCGRGKTEASLFGALNIMKEQHKNKIIFALPTQITSNYMCERLKNIFGDENVGLYHGMSKFFGDETPEKIEDENNEEFKFNVENNTSKVFGKPVVVTTIDHLLYSFVHGYKQADFALGNILNSVVIFDEIHYYDTHTLSYILEGLGLMHKLKIPNIIMSGTLPDFIVKKLKETIKLNEKEFKQKYGFIEDDEGMKYQPFFVKKNEKTILENIDKIKEIYKQKKLNQIIILNTVERTQEIYKKLKKLKNVLLYHSQFNFKDRRAKERKINDDFKNSREPWIIVSTQAIEISVDISCDIMHTELAPADSIGQRGGRLNRGRKYHKNQFIMNIYKTEDNKPYCYSKNGELLLKDSEDIITEGPISYALIKGWCNSIYNKVELEDTYLINIFKKCILFGHSVREVRGYSEEDNGSLVEIREIKLITVDVLPSVIYNKRKTIIDLRNLQKYLVKIPYWRLTNSINNKLNYFIDKCNKHDRKIWICNISYNDEIGFEWNDTQTGFKDNQKDGTTFA